MPDQCDFSLAALLRTSGCARGKALFCTGGLSLGYMTQANPENRSIVDGRLYITRSKRGQEMIRADPDVTIAKAEDTWAVFEGGFAQGTGGHLGGELPLTADATGAM